jgi:hypothetical protein
MFGPDRQNIHASEFLYKNHVMVVRAHLRPPTLLDMDMIDKGFSQFCREPDVDPNRAVLVTETLLDDLFIQGVLDEKDFLDSTEILCELGQTVMVSNCRQYQLLNAYLSDYKIPSLAFLIRARKLLDLFSETFYQNMDGRLLAAVGEVFTRQVRFYAYPTLGEESTEPFTTQNLPVPEGVKFLYRHLLDNRQIVDVENYDARVLHIYFKEVLEMIAAGKSGWEKMVPAKVAGMIKEKELFGYAAAATK